MIIYPKTSEHLEGLQNLEIYVKRYKGIEIQVLNWENDEKIFNVIKELKKRVPEVKEVTIHPPLIDEYNFEVLTYKSNKREQERLNSMIKIANEFNIKVNLLYHTRWNYNCWKESGEIEVLREMVETIQNTNVNLIIENIFSMVDKEDSAVIKIAKEIDNSHLGVCLDICHLHCEANIFKMQFDEFLKGYLNKEDCKKYIYKIHFAGTLDNDGYVEKRTHGRKHDTIENFLADYKILTDFEIEDKIIVTEVSEDDYSLRLDQVEEIKMLESINAK